MKKSYFSLWAIWLVLIVATPEPALAFIRGGSIQMAACASNGSDGFSGAPASTTAQFPSLLATYGVNVPSWCVAGVGYAVGYTPNATVSGSTITETGNANNPANNDKKSFYPQSGGSLPGGITQGTAYFLCNVTNTIGSTYTYTLSTTTACGAPVTLSGAPPSFVALKIPGSTTNTPANTSGWNGAGGVCGSNLVFDICVTGSAVTLDHWDFSAGGGWTVHLGSAGTGTIVTNDYFQIGTNANGVILDGGANPNTVTFSNNVVDGNAVGVYTTANGATASGTTITVASTAGIAVNMTVCDITKPAAITCPGVFVSSIGAGSVTLSAAISSSVNNGDSLGFVLAPYSFPPRSIYQQPQISFGVTGALVAQYNYIKNTYSEHWQFGFVSSVASSGITFKYNLFENTGWGVPITGAITHSDVVQIYGVAGSSFQNVDLNYNTVVQNTALAPTDSGTFTTASGTNGATSVTLGISNNTAVYPVGSGSTLTSNYGLFVVNPSWFSTSMTFQNNYEDPTSACPGTPSGCGAAAWGLTSTSTGGSGPSSPTCVSTGNVNMKTGGALPKPAGAYC